MTKTASVQGKCKSALPQMKSEKTKQQQQHQQPLPLASVTNQQQKHPEEVREDRCFLQTAVQQGQTEESRQNNKQKVKFDPTDWMDSVSEEPETPQPLR